MKTASELGLNERTYEALVEVRDKLASGKLKHLTEDQIDTREREVRGDGVFNMNIDIKRGQACGTVGCIGGWMGIVLGLPDAPAWDGNETNFANSTFGLMSEQWGEKARELFGPGLKNRTANNPLHDLFFPDLEYSEVEDFDADWDRLDTKLAVKAIDYFLKTGDAKAAWDHAVND